MQNKVLFVFFCRSLELALGKLWSCILMLLKIININSDYPSISSHLQVYIDLVVQDNNNRQRHDVLDHAGEQSVPDPVLCMKGISIVPILQINIIGRNLYIYCISSIYMSTSIQMETSENSERYSSIP